MTKELEKKAKEYIKSIDYSGKYDSAWNTDITQAYITGAKENSVVWHDLRKNPNDLPSSDRWVLIQEGTRAYYDAASNSWCDDSNDILLFLIIAWCEIPTFEEQQTMADIQYWYMEYDISIPMEFEGYLRWQKLTHVNIAGNTCQVIDFAVSDAIICLKILQFQFGGAIIMNYKERQQFRKSDDWKKFKAKCRLHTSVDFITKETLQRGWNLHHLDLNTHRYDHIEDMKRFMPLNKTTHETIHILYKWYKKDPRVLDRIRQVLEKMSEYTNEA